MVAAESSERPLWGSDHRSGASRGRLLLVSGTAILVPLVL